MSHPATLQSREISAIACGPSVTFALAGDSWRRCLHVDERGARNGNAPLFTLVASDDTWRRILDSEPAPGFQSVVHLVGIGKMSVSGDHGQFERNVHLVRAVIEAIRGTEPSGFVPQRMLAARGEYHRVSSAVGVADIYVERCGRGYPIVALATAGSSITQWHGLMTESDLMDRYELVTIDLPWHGNSAPTFGSAIGEWRLDPETYTDFIIDAVRTIGVPKPVLLGVSMAGAAVVHTIATRPGDFAGAVACQAGPLVRNRSVPQLFAADIDQSVFVPERIYGLINPLSPSEFRKRVWWGYSSGGHRLYAADIDSYQQWNVATVADRLTSSSPHIALLSGRFDTTVKPADTRELMRSIPNSSFCEMRELGHFPHAENPARFADYLEGALRRVFSHS